VINPAQKETEDRFEVIELPRGGQLISWGDLVVQVGAYPETIKDTMGRPHGVPSAFLLPERLFDVTKGVSRAEIEFPVYFNFYLRGQKTLLICQRRQLKPVMQVLQEAIFGPRNFDLTVDYPEDEAVPDLASEMASFKKDSKRARGRLRIKDLVDFALLDDGHPIELAGVTISRTGTDRFQLERNGLAREITFSPPPKLPPLPSSTRRYRPPFFGVTVIGSGHGFDPNSDTSGFVVWINGRGVLVDPPVDTTRWMKLHGVDSRLIDDLVLTHCHADHDAGTLQKLLEEGRVRLHSTHTVIDSFIRKYRGVLGLTSTQVRALFDFSPVTIGQPVNIAGGSFVFRYNFHPIPTLGFDVAYQGRSVAYSGDHLNDREQLSLLHDEGLFSEKRLEELLDFRWDADLILHEAGVPPIHTPVETLCGLDEETKSRLYVNHISQDRLPPDGGLKLAPPGVDATLVLEVTPPELWLAQRMLDLFAGVDLLNPLGIDKVAEFLRIASYRKYGEGEVLVRTGDPGDSFFLILSGEAEVIQKGEVLTRLGRYDYFGEVAVLLSSQRTADVRAYTELEVLRVARQDFLRFIFGTEIERSLQLVAESRLHEGWPLMNENSLLARLSVKQKTQLIPAMRQRNIPTGKLLFRAGDRIRCLYLIKDGQVKVEREGWSVETAGRGSLLGRVKAANDRHSVTVTTTTDSVVYVINIVDLEAFFRHNPGTYVRFLAAARSQLWEKH
jgi:CRP-like cAMP-binding protein/glyoxylase-like metal-dependent hydrolase (beta-lactamase superfamily II)